MRKINKPLGWKPKEDATPIVKMEDVGPIVNKEAPAKRERKTKKVEPETVVAEAVADVPQQPETIPQEVVEQVAEELSAFKEETPAEPTA